MKKLLLLFSVLFVSSLFAQSKMNPLIVVDAQKIGFMQDHKDLIENMNPNDISTLTVYKDSLVCKKYGSNSGVIVITNKKLVLFLKKLTKDIFIKMNCSGYADWICG